jgi:hypothetical protein
MSIQARALGAKAAPMAVVCRAPHFRESSDQYLVLTENGQPKWASGPRVATPFQSMREAARVALRLPACEKAYGLPRDSEITLRGQLH